MKTFNAIVKTDEIGSSESDTTKRWRVKYGTVKESIKCLIKKPVFKIFLIGLIIRLVLMPLFTYGYDVTHWAIAMQHIQAGAGLYEITGYWYTPVWGYFLSIWSNVMDLFGISNYGHFFEAGMGMEHIGAYKRISEITTLTFNFLVKIPILIADIFAGWIIFKIIRDRTRDEKKATYGFALWFLCPYVIFTSAVHGMFDSIVVMFTLLSVYALFKDQNFLAGASLAVAVMMKVFPVVLIFVFIAFLAMKHKGDVKAILKQVSIIIFAFCLMALIIYTPQILDGTVMDSLRFLTSRIENVDVSVQTRGDILTRTMNTIKTTFVYSEIVALIMAPVFAYLMYRRGDGNKDEAFFSCMMISLALLFVIQKASQYMLILIPFLIFIVVMIDKRFKVPFIILSCAATLYAMSMPAFSLLSSLAAYTNLLDLSTIVSWFEWLGGYTSFGVMRYSIAVVIPWLIELACIITVIIYWIRYEWEVRKNA